MRRLVFRHEARRASLWAIAWLGALAIVLPVVGRSLDSRVLAVALLGTGALAALIVVGWAIVIGVVAPRRRLASDADVARWVGKADALPRDKPLASDLLSSVELHDGAARAARPGAPSAALVAALIDTTESQLATVEPEALVPAALLRRPRRWAIAGAIANIALVAVAPHVVADGWRRLVMPPPAPFDGAQVSTVPLVGDLDATLHFPAYSKRGQLDLPSSSGDLRGLPGTTVQLKGRVLVPAQEVEIVFDPESALSAQPAIPCKLDGDQLVGELTIAKGTHYRFAVTSPTGARSIEATPRAIDAEPDQAPVVQLIAPGDPLDVSNLRRVELAYTIEDDFGLSSAELVWEAGKDHGRKPISLDATARAQGKLLWDIAEVQVPSGGEVRYWIEAKDNDTVNGPNVGRSRELHLRVISPRERHEETLARQRELAEKVIRHLGVRLTGPGDDAVARDDDNRLLRDIVVELGSLAAAFDKDPHASDTLRKSLAAMRDRLDHAATAEVKLVPKGKTALKGAYTNVDAHLVGELEDDTIALVDWLDREQLEGLLDLSDEIAAHQKRLKDLLADYGRTKDPRVLDEIQREMRALDKAYADLERHQRAMPEDVLDQYVNQQALQPKQGCIDEVRKLVDAGKLAEAQAKLEQCRAQHQRAADDLEGSLAALRGDKFSDEQKKLDEVMNELSDVAKDQDDIAAEANRVFETYAEKADEVARGNKREAQKRIGPLVDKLRKRIHDVNEAGLTPFAKEEMDVVERRLADVEHMVGDGDLAEALAMAQQAKQSLDTIGGELEAAMADDPKSKWAEATQDALDGVGRSTPVAKELIDELQSLAPRPDQILSQDDQRALDKLRRRQQGNKDRAKKLGDKANQLGADLPGDASAELGKKLGGAMEQMGNADERMKERDPSGAREATRAAADALAKARDRARAAARQAQEGAINDEPVRIPGADDYKAPQEFREQALEGMKKKGPSDFQQMNERYLEELTK
nr:hypothetical protein [Kofleriaceae bacterium]